MSNDVDDFDIGEGAASAAPDAAAKLNAAAKMLVAQKDLVDRLEGDLKAAKVTYQQMSTKDVPDLMMELGQPTWTAGDYELALSDFVNGSLPKVNDPQGNPIPGGQERRDKAIRLLETYGAAGLIKTELSIEFGKSQHNEAIDLAERLKAEGHPVNLDSGVHPQTLMAFARQRIEDGQDIDLDALGLYTGKVVKPKLSKTAKKARKS
jgi:hypothetical protein